MSEPELLAVQKFGYHLPVSRELLLAHGLVEPNEEERQSRDKWRQVHLARFRETSEWLTHVEAVTDPLAQRMLALHSRDERYRESCQGCDIEGYEAEEPSWPCRTVRAVMAYLGHPAPEHPELRPPGD